MGDEAIRQQDVTETAPAPEVDDTTTAGVEAASEATADEAPRADDRIGELTRQLADAQRLLTQAQQSYQESIQAQLQHRAQPPDQNPIEGWQPEWDQHPGMVALKQSLAARDRKIAGLEQAQMAMIAEGDRLQTRLQVQDEFENGTQLLRKHSAEIEQRFLDHLKRGQLVSRRQLLGVIAAEKGEQLIPAGTSMTSATRQTQRRAARSAQVETGAPVRKATATPPPKTMKEMTPAERRQALEAYTQERVTQGQPL